MPDAWKGAEVTTLADHVRSLIETHERPRNISAVVCPRGDHLRVAQRWRWRCERCQQPIESGAVGVATWDDERSCDIGGYSFQHGCGEWNSPVEVTIPLDRYEPDLPDDDPEREYVLDEIAERVVTEAVNRLDYIVTVEVGAEAERVLKRLTTELRDVLAIANGLPRDEAIEAVRDAGYRGDEMSPGVYHMGQWVAWDYHPYAFTDDTLTVTEEDLEDGEERFLRWELGRQ